jgi:hypothetical protein
MGIIEDEYNRANGQGPARNPGVPLRPSAPQPGTPPAPNPTATHPLRAAAPVGESLGQTVNGRAGPPAPSPVRTAIEGQPAPNLGQTVAERVPQGPQLPPEQHPLRTGAPAGPNLGQTVADRAAGSVRAAAQQATAAPGNVFDKLNAAQLRYGDGTLPNQTLAETIKGRVPAPPYNGAPPVAGAPPATAAAGGVGAPPPGTPPGTAGGPSFASRAGKAIGDAARAAMPQGSGAVLDGGTALGKAVGSVAKKALPWVEPVHEAINVARVANDPKATAGDVVQQAVEGTGRWGSTVGGATLGGAAGALVGGPAAPATAFIGGVAGGIAGYMGGDAAVNKLRSVFGLGDKSPIEKTEERRQADVRAQAKLPAISEPVVQPPKLPGAAPATIAAAAPGAGPARTAADTPQRGAPTVSPIAQQLAALQAQQDASPIAHTTIGGAGSQVTYKDGSMSPLLPGQAIPDDVAQFNALHQRMNALRNGTPMPEDMGAPAAAAGRTVQASAPANMRPAQQMLHAEAVNQGYDPMRAMMISSIETGGKFDAAAKNPKSSAFGLVQMTKANRDSYGLSPEQWADPAVQARTGIDFMKKTDAQLTNSLGRAPTPAESYMGHLFGPAGATSVLSADPNQKMLDVVRSYDPKNANAIVNNNGFKGLTVGQAVNKLTKMTDDHMSRISGAGQQGGGLLAAAATGVVPQVETGVNNPVHIIKGMAQGMAVPTASGYVEMPKEVYDAARRSPTGFAQNGLVNNYLDGLAQNAGFRSNPVSAELAKEAVRGQYQNQGQEIQGRYGVQQQGISAAGHLAAAEVAANADHNKITVIGGGDAIDPVTKMPIKQPQQGVYMKDGVPTPVELPKAKPSEQEAHAQARAAIAGKANKDEVNARLVANGYKPLPN